MNKMVTSSAQGIGANHSANEKAKQRNDRQLSQTAQPDSGRSRRQPGVHQKWPPGHRDRISEPYLQCHIVCDNFLNLLTAPSLHLMLRQQLGVRIPVIDRNGHSHSEPVQAGTRTKGRVFLNRSNIFVGKEKI